MARPARLLLVGLIAASAAFSAGCPDKTESQPNPELGKAPEPPPGRGAGKSGALDPNMSKAAPKS